jgi:hypothetical protein
MAGDRTELEAVERRYLDHLTDADRRLLAAAAPGVPVVAALGREPVFQAVFAGWRRETKEERLLLASPFLAFAVAVHRTAADLRRTSYVPEWVGPGRRVPVFAGAELAAFLDNPRHALFLAELLASYASVASGSYLTRTPRGWRRRRWSELDVVRLAELVDVVPAAERAGVYRRLGDVALFLTGIFPDYTARHGLGGVGGRALLVSAGLRHEDPRSGVELLEELGPRWYGRAVATAVLATAETSLLEAVADRFVSARRVLNAIADNYLFPAGNPWFPSPG